MVKFLDMIYTVFVKIDFFNSSTNALSVFGSKNLVMEIHFTRPSRTLE